MSNLNDRIYSWLLKKSRNSASGNVRASTSMVGLCQDVINDPIEVRKSLDSLRRGGKVEYSATPNGEPVSAYIKVVPPLVNTPEHESMWASALALSGINDGDVSALEPLAASMQGFSDIQMLAIIDGLKGLRHEQQALFGQPLFNVSAKYLLGSSKILSIFNNRALKSFGIEIDRFPDRPPYIVVGGNDQNPEAVILVENPISFETAIQSNAGSRCAFVCTFGFGLSNVGSEFGYQLAGAIETGNLIVLNRHGSQFQSFDNLMQHPQVHFWGDLDMAGMQIFDRIACKVPQLKLSAIYLPMFEALTDPARRHPYVAAVGKSGQRIFAAVRKEAEAILSRCSEYAVDQEIVTVVDIEKLSGYILDETWQL